MIMRIRPTPNELRWYHLTIGGVILAACGALAIWGASPYAHLIHHETMGAGHHALLPRLVGFLLGWALMTVAMMLPGSLPLLHRLRQRTHQRLDRNRLVAQFILGYLAIWALFGLLAYLGDSLVHAAVERFAPRAAASDAIAAAVLLVAGVYQFTPSKRACLAHCRPPYALFEEFHPAEVHASTAWQLGLRHGFFCVGSCWALMLLMFALGGMNLVWMLALGALMAVERIIRWGQHLAWFLGLALMGWAILLLAGYLPLAVV